MWDGDHKLGKDPGVFRMNRADRAVRQTTTIAQRSAMVEPDKIDLTWAPCTSGLE